MGTPVRDHTDTALKIAVPPQPPQGADESNRKTDIAKLVSHLRISWLPVESLSLVLGEDIPHYYSQHSANRSTGCRAYPAWGRRESGDCQGPEP